MSKTTTFIVAIFIIGAMVGGYYLLSDGNGPGTGLQGQLNLDNLNNNESNNNSEPSGNNSQNSDNTNNSNNNSSEVTIDTSLPVDLRGELKVETPKIPNGDLKVTVLIENNGQGTLPFGTALQYSIYLNDQEVFSKTNTSTELRAGESFEFTYPVSKTIYQYPDSGVVRLEIDRNNSLGDQNRENNIVEVLYSL